MFCKKLIIGQDKACIPTAKRYYQDLVLINKTDVESYSIEISETDAILEPLVKYRITFKLKEGTSGIRFTNHIQGNTIYGQTTKQTSKRVNRYTHVVNFLLFGVIERTKYILNTLDNSDYFACLLHKSGVIEVFGFEFGLETNSYTINGQNAGQAVQLTSSNDGLEYTNALIYKSHVENGEIPDFNGYFAPNKIKYHDYNDDFNDDFTSTNYFKNHN